MSTPLGSMGPPRCGPCFKPRFTREDAERLEHLWNSQTGATTLTTAAPCPTDKGYWHLYNKLLPITGQQLAGATAYNQSTKYGNEVVPLPVPRIRRKSNISDSAKHVRRKHGM